MNQYSSLESVYSSHHTAHGRYGFSYRVADRGPQFAAWIGTGKRVLDLGCRDGSLTQYYARANWVTGVDIDGEALAVARERLGIETVSVDLNREFPFGDESFVVVVAGELLEHLLNPAAVVQEVHRVLEQNGVFVGSVPNSFHWRARLDFLRGRSSEDPTHLHLFSEAKLRQLLQPFSAVEILPVGGIGGRALPVMPAWLSRWIIRGLPAWFANDFLFRATKRAIAAYPADPANLAKNARRSTGNTGRSAGTCPGLTTRDDDDG